MISSRPEPVFGKLRGNVLGGQIATALAGTAPFQQIVRKISNVPADVFGINRFERDKGRARQPNRSGLRPTRSRTALRLTRR